MSIHVVDCFLNGGDFFGIFIRNLGLEFFFESHDQLNGIKRVSAKVFNNLFAATEANADNETLKKVASFYYDPKVLKAEDEESKGTAVPTEIDQQELKDLLKRYQEDLKEQTQ